MENNFLTHDSVVSIASKQILDYFTPTVSACLDCHLANVTKVLCSISWVDRPEEEWEF